MFGPPSPRARPAPSPRIGGERGGVTASRLRQFQVDIRAVDDDVLDEDARLDLVALEIRGQHVDAEPAPLYRLELDLHRQVLLLYSTPRRRHTCHGGDPTIDI